MSMPISKIMNHCCYSPSHSLMTERVVMVAALVACSVGSSM